MYTSTTLSLAVLEWLAHVDPGDAPPELVAIAYELPADEPITRLELGDLPENWRTYPVAETVRRLGADWLNTGETVALVAPSAIIPVAEERNIVLNPEHTSMARLSQVWHERITVDPRLVGAEKP